MQRMIQPTADGSHTIAVPEMHVTYHSMYGAVQESRHVFIEAGLKHLLHQYETLHIFEMGFGTGLNALLGLQQALENRQKIYYYATELFPLAENEYKALNYSNYLQDEKFESIFLKMHASEWNKNVNIHSLFTLHKSNGSLINFSTNQLFNLVFFDAFDSKAQPELWTKEVFEKMFSLLRNKGVLVTYSSKGEVKRAMQHAGFTVEKLKGAPGKREMIRATKELKS